MVTWESPPPARSFRKTESRPCWLDLNRQTALRGSLTEIHTFRNLSPMTGTQSSLSDPSGGRQASLPWVAVVAGPLLLLGPALIRGQVLYWGTPLLQFVPWHTLAADMVLRGELPLWNSWLGMGAPLLANYQSALLYPPNWIMLVISPALGQTLLTMLHWILAGAGMVLFLKRLRIGVVGQTIGALGYALSGYLVARAGFQSINITAAWLPWVLWATERLTERLHAGDGVQSCLRGCLTLSVVLGLQWLGGHAQTAWYTLVLAAVWLGWRAVSLPIRPWRALAWFAASLSWAVGLSAVQLLPTVEYLTVSQRSGSLDPGLAMTYSLWPWRLLGLWSPGLFGNPALGDYWGYANYWEDALYVGMLGILLAIAEGLRSVRGHSPTSGRSRLLVVILGVSLLLALGDNTPVFPFLYQHVPSFGLFQAPSRWSLLMIFGLCVLAASYADSWQQPQGRALYWTRLGTAAAGGMIGFSLLAGRLLPWLEPSFIRSFAVTGLALFGAGLLTLFKPRPLSWRWHAAFLGFILADLVFAGYGLNPSADAGLYEGRSSLAAQVEGHRVYMGEDVERKLKFDSLFRFELIWRGRRWQSGT